MQEENNTKTSQQATYLPQFQRTYAYNGIMLNTICQMMLAWQDAFQTFDWGRAIEDVETTKKEVEHLLLV